MSDHPLLINGQLEEGVYRLNVLNPATEEVGATCARASEAQLDPSIPFSGAKTSGIGTELGREGVEELTQQKIVNMAL